MTTTGCVGESGAVEVGMLPRRVFAREGRRLEVSNMFMAVSAIALVALSVMASTVMPKREIVSSSSVSSAVGRRTGQGVNVERTAKCGSEICESWTEGV